MSVDLEESLADFVENVVENSFKLLIKIVVKVSQTRSTPADSETDFSRSSHRQHLRQSTDKGVGCTSVVVCMLSK